MGSGSDAAGEDVMALLAAKDAENAALRSENMALLARLAELETLLANLFGAGLGVSLSFCPVLV